MGDAPATPAPRRLTDRHAVVTGAGTGIGRAIALRLAAEGAAVSLLARREEPLAETAEAIAAATPGARTYFGTVDVRAPGSVDDAFAAAVRALGPIYAVVANAGIGGPNEPGDGDRWDDLVSTNLGGTYACFRAGQRHLEAGPGPRHLVAISSILGRIGVPGYTGYCASKAGVLGLVRALACELAAEDVHVNAVCPGWVNTEMARQGIQGIADEVGTSYDGALEMAMSQVPMARMSEPEDVAGLVAWLLSPDSRGVTGQGLDMNGGAFML